MILQISVKKKGEKMDTATANAASLESRTHELYEENCKLNELTTKCQQKAHKLGLEVNSISFIRKISLKSIFEINNSNCYLRSVNKWKIKSLD